MHGGISIDNPIGVDLLLLSGMEVVRIVMKLYPIDPGVSLVGGNSTSFVTIGDFIFTS